MRIGLLLALTFFAVGGAVFLGQHRTQAAADRTLEWRAKAETDAWLRYLTGNGVELRSLMEKQPLPPYVRELVDAYVPSADVFMFHFYDAEGALKGQFSTRGREHNILHETLDHSHGAPQANAGSHAHEGSHNHRTHSGHADEHAGELAVELSVAAARVVQTGEPFLNFSEGKKPDGSKISYVEGYFPIIVAGETIGVVETFIDISETKTEISELFQALALEVGGVTAAILLIPLLALAFFARALLQANQTAEAAKRRAERAEVAKANFLANMSHELRTPMNGVVATIDMLEQSKMNTEQSALIDTLRKSSVALLEIINDILDFSRIDSEQIELREESFDIVELVESAISLFAPSAHAKGVRIHLDSDLDPLVWVKGDPGKLRQCCLNLIGNAVKFTNEGWVKVTLRVADPGVLRLTVADTGIGIPDDKIDLIFDAFAQADAGSARSYEGTGLGLAITRRLLGHMGGTIEARKCAKGAQFDVELPLQFAKAPRDVCNRWDNYLAESAAVATRLQALPADLFSSIESMAKCAGLKVLDEASSGDLDEPDVVITYNPPKGLGSAGTLVLSRPAAKKKVELNAPWDRESFVKSLVDLMTASPTCVPAHAAKDHVLEALALEGRTILVVEDNQTNRFIIKKMLEPTGACLLFAENGVVGLEMYKSTNPWLVLMDMSMPVMDGVSATKGIRDWEQQNDWVETPIIALTANAQLSDQERCLEAGMTGFLTKPLERWALVSAISAVMDAPEQHEPVRFVS